MRDVIVGQGGVGGGEQKVGLCWPRCQQTGLDWERVFDGRVGLMPGLDWKPPKAPQGVVVAGCHFCDFGLLGGEGGGAWLHFTSLALCGTEDCPKALQGVLLLPFATFVILSF